MNQYLRYLESTTELLAMRLDDLQAAACVVCVRHNLGKLRRQDVQRLTDLCRELSSAGDRSFRAWYCEPDLAETDEPIEKSTHESH